MARPHVPQFGNWESGDNVPYTVYFDKARQGRGTGKMINPNDPQENPELFAQMAPQAQPKQVRPSHERRTSRQSVGSERSFDQSPLHYQAKVATKKGSSSPAWDINNSYGNTHGTPDRPRTRTPIRGRENPDRVAAVPKFGDWDESNPSSGDGYTHIFNKVREEKNSASAKSPNRINEPSHPSKYNDNDNVKGCCFPWGRK